ncbi:MAG: hypothetical protein OEV42_02025 [Deltaproteobacteria bacterium]|nr:hypothetical protein [Deltaproteobacteria bacterium]
MKNYIGLGTSPHDSSIAIVNQEGELVYAEGLERPFQSKRAWGIVPDHCMVIDSIVDKYVDKEIDTVASISWSRHIDLYHRFLIPFFHILLKTGFETHRKSTLFIKYTLLNHSSLLRQVTTGLERALSGSGSKLSRRYYNHHLSHVAAAAYGSPYEEALCAVMDGFGEGGAMSAFHYCHGQLKPLEHSKGRASLGLFYSWMCEICGFSPMKGEEWKVMGLAAYGRFDEELYDLMRPMIVLEGLKLRLGKDPVRERKLNGMVRKREIPALEYANFACTAQQVFNEIYLEYCRQLYDLGLSNNLALGGGCALNSSANGLLIDNTPFENLYINSAPGDDGAAVGAAYLAYYEDHRQAWRPKDIQSPYLGSEISRESVERLAQFSGLSSTFLDDDTLYETVAKKLSEGAIIGWIQGRAEFGPRALGNRSILADPRRRDIKEVINERIKFREEFRPFAPAILDEEGHSYFENYQTSPYMERTLKFRESVKNKVPGVVHEDGTGRLQSVTKSLNPSFYDLIQSFKKLTGIPLLLNTSFNVMGKPMAHSAEDAVALFMTTGLDYLVIGKRIFAKGKGKLID